MPHCPCLTAPALTVPASLPLPYLEMSASWSIFSSAYASNLAFEVNNAGILTQETERAEKSGTERDSAEQSGISGG